jgi:hypothetical protein
LVSSPSQDSVIEAYSLGKTFAVNDSNDARLVSDDAEIDVVIPVHRESESRPYRVARYTTVASGGDSAQMIRKLLDEPGCHIDPALARDVIEFAIEIPSRTIGKD